eukprot:155981-Pleurochrysis_carterae.AAC.1
MRGVSGTWVQPATAQEAGLARQRGRARRCESLSPLFECAPARRCASRRGAVFAPRPRRSRRRCRCRSSRGGRWGRRARTRQAAS